MSSEHWTLLDIPTGYFYWILDVGHFYCVLLLATLTGFLLERLWSAFGALNLAFLNASSLVPLFAFSVLSR